MVRKDKKKSKHKSEEEQYRYHQEMADKHHAHADLISARARIHGRHIVPRFTELLTLGKRPAKKT